MQDFFLFAIIGFFAQMLNGSLGMAYGVVSSAFLLSIGIPPISASASIHLSKLPIGLVSGLFHLKYRNVNKLLLKKLLLSGIVGGILGVVFLASFNADFVRPFVSLYLLLLGIYILFMGINRIKLKKMQTKIMPAGFLGGFLSSLGGGGWGTIVTTSLVIRGNSPRRSVGTVNVAGLFVALAQVFAFLFYLGFEGQYLKIVLGLTLGGMLAAPVAAYLSRKINVKYATIGIGILVIIVNTYALIKYI